MDDRCIDQRIGKQELQLLIMNLVTVPSYMNRLQSGTVGQGGVVLTTSHHNHEPTNGASHMG